MLLNTRGQQCLQSRGVQTLTTKKQLRLRMLQKTIPSCFECAIMKAKDSVSGGKGMRHGCIKLEKLLLDYGMCGL